ncbi:aryl-alcohol dehydrogenase-like predicted oxidoreductase [Paenibacillus sp. V4I3]|nr:aryl-alcohol dehydrogenase-like predicted oxidoreductase [Paenibacillus sp. V4I3]MDQ0888211.1 aryl-alcohol dehydrogenase-like predicted oxidoreductase [Paenibacillus sp. V4I9]
MYRTLGKSYASIPVIGQGTWKFGEIKQNETQEIDALNRG